MFQPFVFPMHLRMAGRYHKEVKVDNIWMVQGKADPMERAQGTTYMEGDNRLLDYWEEYQDMIEETELLDDYLEEECPRNYDDGEEEAEWLRTAGLGQLTEAWKVGKEVPPEELGAALRPLSRAQAEAVKRRVKSLNHTVKQRFNQRQRVRKPDIRDVFKDVEASSTGTRSRSATPDSLDSVTGATPESAPTITVPTIVTQLGDSVYRASYIPLTPDPLLMTVSWNGRQLKGCPLQINVTSAADASRVICSGDGLKHGIVGQEIRSFIDTRRAGPGELTAHCVGPHKVAYCELYDHGDATFTLNVKPQEAGRHALTIKYAGEHVPGSPFTLRVSGAPDASKVRVYGPGIEHGVLATFQSRFICDTRGAGAGQLTVRVRGPKGAFRVEMQRETQKDRIILCRYDPTEPGDYRVEVRWAGVLVPGSPFPVKIVDTQDELLMLTQGGDNYSTGHHTIASWRGSQAML